MPASDSNDEFSTAWRRAMPRAKRSIRYKPPSGGPAKDLTANGDRRNHNGPTCGRENGMSYFRATPTKRLRTEPYSSSTSKTGQPGQIDRTEPRTYRTNAAGGSFSTAGSNHRTAGRARESGKQEQYDMEKPAPKRALPQRKSHESLPPKPYNTPTATKQLPQTGYKGASQGEARRQLRRTVGYRT